MPEPEQLPARVYAPVRLVGIPRLSRVAAEALEGMCQTARLVLSPLTRTTEHTSPDPLDPGPLDWSALEQQGARLLDALEREVAQRGCGCTLCATDHIPSLDEHTPPDPDLVKTLMEFARAGQRAAFRELAAMRGVPAEKIPAMWEGTVKRVRKT